MPENARDILIVELVDTARALAKNIQEGDLTSQYDKEAFDQMLRVIEFLNNELIKKEQIIQSLLKPVAKV